jgi:hypothetical protein
MAGLLHAVDTFHQVHDPVFLAGNLETRWLFHEHTFVGGQYAVEEGGFDVELLEIPVEAGSKVE